MSTIARRKIIAQRIAELCVEAFTTARYRHMESGEDLSFTSLYDLKDFQTSIDVTTGKPKRGRTSDETLVLFSNTLVAAIEDNEANIYGESEKKYFKKGIRVNCLISWDTSYNLDDFGSDKNVTVELYFHRTTL